MTQTINLSDKIITQLPSELVQFMKLAGSVAARQEQGLFLVGGVVRDLLLKRQNLDLDLVAEGDAIQLAEELARLKNGRVIAHSRFNTARVRWDKWSVDIATARSESYDKPGALPDVQCRCDIKSDLVRRDFTINAMAAYLDPEHFGELIDIHNGLDDLRRGLIRILHDNSFRDDATRIWRAVRYEQRLGFVIERHTLSLLKRDIGYLDTISGDRIRHELELCLEEDKPEKSLLRAGGLGILSRVHPELKADDWLARKISHARTVLQPYSPPAELILAFLVYRLNLGDLESVINRLKFSNSVNRVLHDTLKLKSDLPALARPGLAPSEIYRHLHSCSRTAILANLLVTEDPLVRQHIELYLNKLRNVRPALTGEDIVQMKIAAGPRIKEVLDLLREARLDGKVHTREDELAMVGKISREIR